MRTREFVKEFAKTKRRNWGVSENMGSLRCGGSTCPIAAVAGIKGEQLWSSFHSDKLKEPIKRLGLNKKQIGHIMSASDYKGTVHKDLRNQLLKAIGLSE